MQDSFLWLEELHSKKSLAWVAAQNLQTIKRWTGSAHFNELQDQALHMLGQKDKLTMGVVYRDEVYHLWQDATNPIGLWRKARVDSLKNNPQWQTLLDLDQLSLDMRIETFLGETSILKNSSRVLLNLAPQGKDACEVKEWDLESGGFVEEGFATRLSKDELSWMSKDEVIWSSTETATECGYSAEIYSWKRNSEPQLILEIPKSSMSVWPHILNDSQEQPHLFVVHNLNWDDHETWYWQEGKLCATGLPLNMRICGLYKDRLVIWLEKPWQKFAADSILICREPRKWAELSSEDFDCIFEPSEKISFQEFQVFKGGVAISYTDVLKNRVCIWTDSGSKETSVPEGISVGALFSPVEEDRLYTSFQSFSEPPGWFEFKESGWENLQSAVAHFATENVKAKQEWATSQDGTEVPYWVVYDDRFQFPRPTLQYGYGGFLTSLFPTFSSLIGGLWLERGGIHVLAQIRGGAEFGTKWHSAAILENKQKSYDDFISISEDLIAKGYTTSSQLAIQGRSNGGLLVGATITQRPDLYGAAVIEVPLLDMFRYVELPPGSSWTGEYGDPREAKFAEIIGKYSPYQNIEKNSQYPPILIRTARSDDRVHPAHARKMAAKLQMLGHPAWFFEEELGGHRSTPIKDKAFQLALVYEFLWKTLSSK